MDKNNTLKINFRNFFLPMVKASIKVGKFKKKVLILKPFSHSLKIKRSKKQTTIVNSGSKKIYIPYAGLLRAVEGTKKISFYGKTTRGDSARLFLSTLKGNQIGISPLDSTSFFNYSKSKPFIVFLEIPANSEHVIESLSHEDIDSEISDILLNLHSDKLIVAPGYPSEANKYMGGFVHSRAIAYKNNNIEFDVVCAHLDYKNTCIYNFEGVRVVQTTYSILRQILQNREYKKILLHFLDPDYARILDAATTRDSDIFLWIHGPETLYYDWPLFTTPYFKQPAQIPTQQLEAFKLRDEIITKFNNKKNIHWVFVSQWIKDKSEELLNISFKQYSIIPNVIDDKNFSYTEKDPSLRKNIFTLRRFDNTNKYAIDLTVKTILELSKRDFFKELEFNIYGDGDYYNELIDPIRKFKNVKLNKLFLSHEQIAKVHKKNGIALFPTRYDAQGVSMCEAAMSGLVVVSSDNDGIKEFLPNSEIILNETEDPISYANSIEKIIKNEKLFTELSSNCHNTIKSVASFSETIAKEIDLINSKIATNKKDELATKEHSKTKPILSIVVPCYNVKNYIKHTLFTLIDHGQNQEIEIIAVNDGSKDSTVKIIRKFISDHPEIKIHLIDKENGGHGSTINAGLEKATGRYFRTVDGDDWVDSLALEKLIKHLKSCDSDIVVTDYSHDTAFNNKLTPDYLYEFMIPDVEYNFDDLCLPVYGFSKYGPVLATANYKTDMLKKTDFKLTEKSFYVDMEYNAYSIINAKSIKYLPLNIYRYFVGREGQSVSCESFKNNYKQHENVILNLINITRDSRLSHMKTDYIRRNLLDPMIEAQILILKNYIKSSKELSSFKDKLLSKNYPIS